MIKMAAMDINELTRSHNSSPVCHKYQIIAQEI
jgi:hypothetical protein